MTMHGTLVPEQVIDSAALGGGRTIRVYLPPSYHLEPRRRYPVLYVHDGQNVFSPAGPHSCFGWGSWELDVTADWLIRRGHMREILMVAVDNSRSRYREYRGMLYPEPVRATPTAPVGRAVARGVRGLKGRSQAVVDERRSGRTVGVRARARGGAGGTAVAATTPVWAPGVPQPGSAENARFEAYSRFLRDELKPRIDREYRTLKTAANTGLLGSSLGGICSLALGWEHPEVFGRVASLSGSFHIERRNFLEHVLRPSRSSRKPLRIYLDSGTVDHSGDDDGFADTSAVVAELRRLGWRDGRTLMHFTDLHPLTEEELGKTPLPHHKWGEAQASQHNEFYWRLRVWRALAFLFPPLPAKAAAAANG